MHNYSPARKALLATAVVLVVGVLAFFGWQSLVGSRHQKVAGDQAPIHIGIIRFLGIYNPEVDGFLSEMEQIGYKEGVNVFYTRRDVDRVADVEVAARELIAEDVDLIYAVTTVAANGALKETIAAGRTDIPIIFAQGNLAVRAGIVQSLQSSGNHVTGVAVDFVELTEKKLEFLKLIDPSITKVGYFDAKHADPATEFNLEELKLQAPRFGITLVPFPIENPVGPAGTEEIRQTLANIAPGEIDGYFHLPGPLMGLPNQPMIQERLIELGIPGVWLELPSVTDGRGLFSYSHDLVEIGRQAAAIADKVIKGTAPTDIPIEFPRRYYLVVNTAVAKESNIAIPQAFLDIAVKVGPESN